MTARTPGPGGKQSELKLTLTLRGGGVDFLIPQSTLTSSAYLLACIIFTFILIIGRKR